MRLTCSLSTAGWLLPRPERLQASSVEKFGKSWRADDVLPQPRAATSSSLRFGGLITLGHFEDGALAEAFIDGSKVGSDIQATSRDAAIVISLVLQFGCSIEKPITRNSNGAPQSTLGATLDRMC
jgi:hypothetical protein